MRNVIMYAFRLTIGKMIEMSFLDNYKRVVIKIGSSTLTHAETGSLNFSKMERLETGLTMVFFVMSTCPEF